MVVAAASSAASPEGGGAAVPGGGSPQLLHLVVDLNYTAVAAAGPGRPVDTGPAGVQLILPEDMIRTGSCSPFIPLY